MEVTVFLKLPWDISISCLCDCPLVDEMQFCAGGKQKERTHCSFRPFTRIAWKAQCTGPFGNYFPVSLISRLATDKEAENISSSYTFFFFFFSEEHFLL